MALELKQQLKLSQQLVMTPQLQQAIKLLQLSRLELVDAIQQEIEQNPLLEETTPGEEEQADSEEAKAEAAEYDPDLNPAEVEQTAEVQMEPTSSLPSVRRSRGSRSGSWRSSVCVPRD